ncbi:MAG TPA: hypothetical protein VFM18_05260 [Methanosarcina sp.]|nr:hypothetical protein [Methanosarcina sp.]
MSNKYLTKLATGPKAPLTSKVGLAVSTASLGVGLMNMMNNHRSAEFDRKRVALETERNRLQEEQKRLDEKSLGALRGIHKSLAGR